MPFRHTGAKITTGQLSELAFLMNLPRELKRFLMWRNGGTPERRHFTWQHPDRGPESSRVDRFFGLDAGPFDARRNNDMVWAILRFRDWLPRWSIPIAFVDEDSFLVTFPMGDGREDQIWLKEWCHDGPDIHADPDADCYFVAPSAPEFVTMLDAEKPGERDGSPGASRPVPVIPDEEEDMSSLLSAGLIVAVSTIRGELLEAIQRRAVEHTGEFREFVKILTDEYPRANVLVLPAGTEIKGDLDLDWGEPYKDKNFVAIVAKGDLRVSGTIRNTNLDGGPYLFVAGNLRALRIDKGGAPCAILGRVEVDDYILCEYNHGLLRIGGDLKSKALLNLDHDVLIGGKTTGRVLSWNDDDLRETLVPEVFDPADDPETSLPEAARIRKRIAAGLPVLREPVEPAK